MCCCLLIMDLDVWCRSYILQGGSGGFSKAAVGSRKSDSKLTKAAQDWLANSLHYSNNIGITISTYSSKATIEVVHGLMGQVVKDQLFNVASSH